MQQAFVFLLTIVSGGLNPVQSGLTAGLAKALGRPFLVAVVSLGLCFACALLTALATGQLRARSEITATVRSGERALSACFAGQLCRRAAALIADAALRLTADKAVGVPWWGWLAGFAIFIARPYAAPALGAALFTGLTVSTSIACSVLLDHHGLLGFQQHAAGWGRLAGAALMIAGVVLVSVF